MLVPFVGLLLSTLFFAGIGTLVLRLGGVYPANRLVLAVFVIAAQTGLLAFAIVYGAAFDDGHHELRNPATVLGMLVGMPVVGTLTGWMAARVLSIFLARSKHP